MSAKGGKLKSYHEVDDDHLRAAVAFKHLTALMRDHPSLCHFTDVEKVLSTFDAASRGRTAGGDGSSGSRGSRSIDVLLSDHVNVPGLSRDIGGDAFMYTPDHACVARLVAHVAAPPARRGALAQAIPEQLPAKSAVELGLPSPGFRVVVRIRPPLEAREDPSARCLQVMPFSSSSSSSCGGGTKRGKGSAAKAAAAADLESSIVADEVFVRGTATTATASAASAVSAPAAGKKRAGILRSTAPTVGNDQRFVFETVFNEEVSQQQMYERAVRPLLDASLADCADATIFAYGQTGSGKTHSISGSSSSSETSTPDFSDAGSGAGAAVLDPNVGIIPRLVHDLFGRLQSSSAPHGAPAATTVIMTYVEIYDGKIIDLLSPLLNAKLCTLVEVGGSSDSGGGGASTGFRVEGARTLAASTPQDLLSAYDRAASRRATASTNMNDESSRSHAVLTLKVSPTKRSPVINVVDLAGSERVRRSGATGVRMDEAICINSSLLALARVIRALVAKQSTSKPPTSGTRAARQQRQRQQQQHHVPYRGSVLTKMLASSLGGRARTVLVACVAPTSDSKDETISTLRFASMATHVQNDIDKERAQAVEASKPDTGTISATQNQLLHANAAANCSTNTFHQANRLVSTLAGVGDVECYGSFEAGVDAPCVLLLHYYGHGSDGGKQFERWFKPLSEAGYRCLAPSFPGHGNTPGKVSGKPDPAVLAEGPCKFVTQLLHHFGIRKLAIILGYDWGGGVAMEYAIRHSARVGAVVGWSISHRDETRMAKLKRRYSSQKRALFLAQKNSLVHPLRKQQRHAAACGMVPVCVKDDDGALKEVLAFAKSCIVLPIGLL